MAIGNKKANEKEGGNFSVNKAVTRSILHPKANYGTGVNYVRRIKASGGGGGDFGNDFGNDFS